MMNDRTIILKNVRIAFPELHVATQFQGQGEFSYRANLLVDPGSENDKKIRAAINVAAKSVWKDEAAQVMGMIKGNPQKCCYYDGNLKKYDGFPGKWALSASRRKKDGPVKIIDQLKNPLGPESGKPYGGCFVDAKVEFWAQKNKWGNGMRCTLIVVQFRADGDAFSGTGPADDEGMESIEGGEGLSESSTESDLM